MDHFDEGQERVAFYRNVHRPLKMWFIGKGEAFSKIYGTFPAFWQVRGNSSRSTGLCVASSACELFACALQDLKDWEPLKAMYKMYLVELETKPSAKVPAPTPVAAPSVAIETTVATTAPVTAQADAPALYPVLVNSDAVQIVLVPDAPAADAPSESAPALVSASASGSDAPVVVPPATVPAPQADTNTESASDAAAKRKKNRWGSKATEAEVAAAGIEVSAEDAAKANRVKKKRRFDAAPIRKRTYTRFGERKLPGTFDNA
jgi:hypothetical protein